jgi:hypothetical protein
MRIRIRNPLRRRDGDTGSNDFVPTSGRRRGLFALAALATSATIGGAMMVPHAAYVRAAQALGLAEPPPCAPGQLRGCVGGLMDVVVVPAPAAASHPASGASAPR